MVNMVVFIRFAFGDFFTVWMSKRRFGDLILEGFWVPGILFWWFLRVLGMAWNFDGFWDLPWGTQDLEHPPRRG